MRYLYDYIMRRPALLFLLFVFGGAGLILLMATWPVAFMDVITVIVVGTLFVIVTVNIYNGCKCISKEYKKNVTNQNRNS